MTLDAAFWSAVAASFAALAAGATWFIQRKSWLASARPELVLSDWTHHEPSTTTSQKEIVSFRKIKNTGLGPAMNIFGEVFFIDSQTTPFSYHMLRPGEELDLPGRIEIPFDDADDPPRTQVVTIIIHCWDTRNRQHETRYILIVTELSGINNHVTTGEVAPGVAVLCRDVTEKPGWLVHTKELLLYWSHDIYTRLRFRR